MRLAPLVLPNQGNALGAGFHPPPHGSQSFARKLSIAFRGIEAEGKEQLQKMLLDFRQDSPDGGLDKLFECLCSMCENSMQPIVLMIDEVDSASNNQVFIDFLAQLRGYYLKRDTMPIFHSVILAGVYNIKKWI